MRNNRKTSGRRKSKNATFAIPVQFANTKPANAFDARIRKISSKKYKQGTTISSTQKSETEQTQTIGEMKSKTLDPTKLSFKTDKLFSKTPTKHVLGTLGKRKSSNFADEKFDKQKLKDKIEIVAIEHQIPPIRIDTTQDLPDFAQEEPEFKKPEGLESIAPSLLKRKVKSAEPSKSLKTEKIDSKKTDRIDQKDVSFAKYLLSEKYFFPTCIQYTFLRLIALILLCCALIILYGFPCLRFTYHIPVIKKGKIQSTAVKIPLKKTCQFAPHWWSDQEAFIERIIETTHYFRALNLSINQTEEHFKYFEDENLKKILKPFNGQIFVIFCCIILAIPILLLLMFMRCISKEEDLMEEAMFDLVEISIFCVFTVIEFYSSSGAEIRSVMDAVCDEYLKRYIRMSGFVKEQIYNICINVKIEAYGFLSSGFIFLFLVFVFAVDLVILLKNAEDIESRKYLQMAVCLHYDKSLKCMSDSVLEGVFVGSPSIRKK